MRCWQGSYLLMVLYGEMLARHLLLMVLYGEMLARQLSTYGLVW